MFLFCKEAIYNLKQRQIASLDPAILAQTLLYISYSRAHSYSGTDLFFPHSFQTIPREIMFSSKDITLFISFLSLLSLTSASTPPRQLIWPIEEVILQYSNIVRDNVYICDELFLTVTTEGVRRELLLEEDFVRIICSFWTWFGVELDAFICFATLRYICAC